MYGPRAPPPTASAHPRPPPPPPPHSSSSGGAKAPLPAFGGARGPDIARSLLTIEQSFEGYLAKLQESGQEILDVKATRWHEVNNEFKTGVKELEVMMGNVINDAFSGVTAIGTAVDLLEAFSSLAKRPAVQRAVDKKAMEVYGLFSRQLAEVKGYFEAHLAKPPLRPDEPPYAGAALWARGLLSRVDKDWRYLVRAQIYLSPSKSAQVRVGALPAPPPPHPTPTPMPHAPCRPGRG
jgi:dynein heavy chain, axonemal